MLKTPVSFRALCGTQFSELGAQFRICHGSKPGADQVQRRVPNSPKRGMGPQLASNDALVGSTEFLELGAQFWICHGSKPCADDVQKRTPNSPKRQSTPTARFERRPFFLSMVRLAAAALPRRVQLRDVPPAGPLPALAHDHGRREAEEPRGEAVGAAHPRPRRRGEGGACRTHVVECRERPANKALCSVRSSKVLGTQLWDML